MLQMKHHLPPAGFIELLHVMPSALESRHGGAGYPVGRRAQHGRIPQAKCRDVVGPLAWGSPLLPGAAA